MSDNITFLYPTEIFVFGSNVQGYHGKCAALQAMKFGAKRGVGSGMMGQTYAIPTRTFTRNGIRTLSLNVIKVYIDRFVAFAADRRTFTFMLTAIGTGYAGYSARQICGLFDDLPRNVEVVDDDMFDLLSEQEWFWK